MAHQIPPPPPPIPENPCMQEKHHIPPPTCCSTHIHNAAATENSKCTQNSLSPLPSVTCHTGVSPSALQNHTQTVAPLKID